MMETEVPLPRRFYVKRPSDIVATNMQARGTHFKRRQQVSVLVLATLIVVIEICLFVAENIFFLLLAQGQKSVGENHLRPLLRALSHPSNPHLRVVQ